MLARIAIFALLLGAARVQAEDPAAEKQKIEKLVASVENLADASFIRNGKAYDAAAAATFLRRKWDSQAGEIKTALDFIEKAATKSSTSGQPYLIRFKDGSEKNCADFLREQLKKLD